MLATNAKYYPGDIGLRNGLLGRRAGDVGQVLENLVYLELCRRGYRVTVGIADDREIDFVCDRQDGRVYVQVAYLLPTPETVRRELASFAAVTDAYPRVLLTLDPHQPRDLHGVRHGSIIRFLMGDPIT